MLYTTTIHIYIEKYIYNLSIFQITYNFEISFKMIQTNSPHSSTEKAEALLSSGIEPPIETTDVLDKAKSEEYDKIINEKLKMLEEYETLEKELQNKREQLENDLNISVNKSKGMNTPNKKMMKSTSNLIETDSNLKENQMKLNKNFNSYEKETMEKNEFMSYYMKMNSETKLKDEQDYTFKPKINKSSTKKNLDKIVENKDQSLNQTRLDELYKLGLQKKLKQEDLVKQQNNEIDTVINQNKVGLNSKKIILKNMEKSLGKLLLEIENPNNKGLFNFQDVGNMMSKLAIFKGSHYKRKDYAEKPEFDLGEIEKYGLESLQMESNLHEDLWKILSIPQLISSSKEPNELLAENSINLIPCQLILDVILALLETSKEKTIVANLIRDRLLSSYKKQEVPSKSKEENIESHNENIDIKSTYEGGICMPLEKFIGKFRKLFVDKTKVMNIYGSSKEIRPEKDHTNETLEKKNYDFKPKINEKSKNLDSQDGYIVKLVASHSLKEIPKQDASKNRFDLLYNYSKFESKKKEEETKARLKEDYRDCTFAPKINKKQQNSAKKKGDSNDIGEASNSSNIKNNENNESDEKKTYERLYDLYKKKFEKEEINSKIIQEREEEKLIGCTFKPQTNTNKSLEKSLYSSNTTNVKGADKVIERVAKAREERQEKINLFENMGKPKTDNLQPTVFQPFSFEKRYDKEKDNTSKEEPLLYLDINYGPGKIARIPVRKSDDPHVLCKTFSKIYSLNEKMQATLLETIQNIFLTQVWEEKK